MAVELILLDNIENLGVIGNIVRVADGYARNFLIPRGLATKATKAAVKMAETRKRQAEQAYHEQLAAAKLLAERIGGESITIQAEANEQDKLYGSISAQQIVSQLAAEKDIHITRDNVVIAEPIRELGVFNIEIALAPEVNATIKIWVVRS